MKLKINHFDEVVFRTKLKPIDHIDFSLFIDAVPEHQQELSSINILVLQEPNEYFGLHDYAIQNKDLFTFILTWDNKVLNNCHNARYLPFGHTWFKTDQYEKQHNKEFKVAHLCGKLLKTYGQSLRHELLARQNELKVPTKFFDVYGDRHTIEDARKGKEEVFGDVMFGVAIENTSHNGYFTEKLLDCFLLKTIPMYWGCPDVGKLFHAEGIIEFRNVDEFVEKANQLTEKDYMSRLSFVEENYKLALNYVEYENTIYNALVEVFTYNKLI